MQVAHKDQLVVIADILWQLLGILRGFAELILHSQDALTGCIALAPSGSLEAERQG